MESRYYCTAPTRWPPELALSQMQPDDVGGDICWEPFDSAEERLEHLVEKHPQWAEALGVATLRRREEREPPKPLDPTKKQMACYACGTLRYCDPRQLADRTWAWMCSTCPDPTTAS